MMGEKQHEAKKACVDLKLLITSVTNYALIWVSNFRVNL